MANITFSSLKLKPQQEVKKITIADKEIEVLQYLPAENKNDILELTIQSADSGTIVNTFAIDCIFHTYIVIEYTNITFTSKQKEDILGLYDILETNGVIDVVVAAIPEDEYQNLRSNLLDMIDKYAVYRNSARGVMEQLNAFVPSQELNLLDAVSNLDDKTVNRVKEVLGIADDLK